MNDYLNHKWRKFIKTPLLLEANQGDIAEGLFALGLGLLLADPSGKLFDDKFDEWRKILDPDKPTTTTLYKDRYTNKQGVTDLLEVELLLRLKSPKTCSLAFGGGCADFENLPSSLQDKISTIKRELLTTPSIKQLLNARNEFLENNVEEYVKIVINADGVEGEKSGGTLKGDVIADIYVGAGSYEDARRGEVSLNLQDQAGVGWSLKSQSTTVGNLSVLDGFTDLATLVGLPQFLKSVPIWKKYLADKDEAGEKRKLSSDFIKKVSNAFADEFMTIPDTPELTKKIYAFINTQTFGTDKVDIIDIKNKKLVTIAKNALDRIQERGGIIEVRKSVDKNGMPKLWFYHRPPDRPVNEKTDEIFHTRIKWEKARDATHPDVVSGAKGTKTPVFKLMIELGQLAIKPELLDQQLESPAPPLREHLTKSPISDKMLVEITKNLIGKK
jgi:hypothetical protein